MLLASCVFVCVFLFATGRQTCTGTGTSPRPRSGPQTFLPRHPFWMHTGFAALPCKQKWDYSPSLVKHDVCYGGGVCPRLRMSCGMSGVRVILIIILKAHPNPTGIRARPFVSGVETEIEKPPSLPISVTLYKSCARAQAAVYQQMGIHAQCHVGKADGVPAAGRPQRVVGLLPAEGAQDACGGRAAGRRWKC